MVLLVVGVLPVGDEEAMIRARVWPGDLLYKPEQGGDDDGRLKRLSEDDEEDGNAEERLAHGC